MTAAAPSSEPEPSGSAVPRSPTATIVEPTSPDADSRAARFSVADDTQSNSAFDHIDETRPTARRPSDPPTSSGGRLPHFPALDGLRGFALMAVLLCHGGFTWMQGGALAVSSFFTLSGFLITSLLLTERASSSRIDLHHFWVRRARRLMPAALAGLAFAALFGVLAADAAQKRNLAGDVIAALAYVANWRFLFTNRPYVELFAAPSPVLHFWSLAIEEQFYVLFPLIAWFALAKRRIGQHGFAALMAVLIAASVAYTLFSGLSHDGIYYNTFTRAGELLAGALLAALVYRRRVTTAIAHNPSVRRSIGVLGTVALVACVALWSTVPHDAEWQYKGGFTLYALTLSSIVIVSCIAPYGPVRWFLGLTWLRALGTISYGVYIFHWPVYVWLNGARTGWSDAQLIVPRLAITLVLALLSYRFVEEPLRRGQPLGQVRLATLAPIAAGAIAMTVLAVTLTAPKPILDFEAAQRQLEAESNGAPAAQGPIDTAAETAAFPRMAMFGDSSAMTIAFGLNAFAKRTRQMDVVNGDTKLGCGIGRGGQRRGPTADGRMEVATLADQCNHWERNWYQQIVANEPNIAVVQIGTWDLSDRKLEGDNTWRALGDPVYDEFLTHELELAVDRLSADGALVVFLTVPKIGTDENGRDALTTKGDAGRPERVERMNDLLKALPARRPGLVKVVDLAGWLHGTGEDHRLRVDGVHFSPETSGELADRYLGNAILQAYQEGWKQRREIVRTASAADGQRSSGSVSERTASGEHKTVAVVGDETADPLAAALGDWGARTGDLDVVRAISPGCGLLTSTGRKDGDQQVTTPTSCASSTAQRVQTVVAAKPDLVLVIPSRWDFMPMRTKADPAYRTWGDAAFAKSATSQLSDLVVALGKAKAAVVFVDAPTLGGPGAPTDPALDAYHDVLVSLALGVGVKYAFQAEPLRSYVRDRHESGIELLGADGSLAAGTKDGEGATFIDWFANELFSRYDDWLAGGKLAG